MPNVFSFVLPFASLILTINVAVVLADGIPEMTPSDASKDNPKGKEPEATSHVYGPTPPLAASTALYALPEVALKS